MVKKKLNIPKNRLKDLAGFEDVLDMVGIDPNDVHKRDTRPAETFEIYDFLERENQRLKVMDDFFHLKAKNIQEHSQHDQLIEKQRMNKNELQKSLLLQITDPQSDFFQFLDKQFNRFFDHSK